MSLVPRNVRKACMTSLTLPGRRISFSYTRWLSWFHVQVSSKARIWLAASVPSFSWKKAL